MKTNMKLSEKLFNLVGKFNNQASMTVKHIIDEIHMPLSQRLFKPLQILSPRYQPLFDAESDFFDGNLAAGSLVYLQDGIFIKLCLNAEVASRTLRKHVQVW
jgi:hypothetical protein